MLKHAAKRFLHSLMGSKGHSRHYSSSAHKYSKYGKYGKGPGYFASSSHRPKYPPTQSPHNYGHQHYKRKHKSFSSFFSS